MLECRLECDSYNQTYGSSLNETERERESGEEGGRWERERQTVFKNFASDSIFNVYKYQKPFTKLPFFF